MTTARKAICEKFCAYYKPDHFEAPGCAGYEHLANAPEAADHLATLSRLEKMSGAPLFGLDDDDPALLAICAVCTYPPDGCDFRNPDVDRSTCSPCGGLQAVSCLIARGSRLSPDG